METRHASVAMELGQRMIVAGIGCRRGVSAHEVKAAIEAALTRVPPRLELIAIPASKSEESGVFAAAKSLGVGVTLISQADLEQASKRTLTRSARSLAEMNVHCVSEAAALAAAGTSSKLLAPRIALGPVTCALAESELGP
jgi:cobalt-precorrin 5A hydrolase